MRHRLTGFPTISSAPGVAQMFYYSSSSGTGPSWTPPADTYPASGLGEWIVDESPHHFGEFSKCEHYRLELQAPPLSHVPIRTQRFEGGCEAALSQDGEYRTVSGGGIQQSNRYCTFRANHLHKPLHAIRYDPLQPQYLRWYGELEIRNNLADLKTRLAEWGKGRSGFAESVGELPECPRLMQIRTKGKSLIAASSGLYLNGVFGWKPMLALVPDVLKELQNVKRHLRSSAARTLGERVLTFSMPLRAPWGDNVVTTKQCDAYPQTHVTEGRVVNSSRCKMQYMVKCKVTRKWGSCYDALEHLTALDGIPSLITLWELMPMSFLVDYLVHVGDFIARLQGNLLYDIEVLDEAWALNAKVSGTDYTETGAAGRPAHWIANYQMSYYFRGKDTWSLPISFGLPNAAVLPSTVALLGLRFPALRSNVLNRMKRDANKAWNQLKKSFQRDLTSGSWLG